jgi:hypothetical protein
MRERGKEGEGGNPDACHLKVIRIYISFNVV